MREQEGKKIVVYQNLWRAVATREPLSLFALFLIHRKKKSPKNVTKVFLCTVSKQVHDARRGTCSLHVRQMGGLGGPDREWWFRVAALLIFSNENPKLSL